MTPEQRQAQVNRWKETYIATNPALTPQQLALVNSLDTLPGMQDHVVTTTLLRDESSRVMNAAQQAQQQAQQAQQAAEAARVRAETWWQDNVPVVAQLNQQLVNTTSALRAISTVYEIPAEELARYGVQAQTPAPVAPGQPGYQPPAPQYGYPQPQQPVYAPPSSSQPQYGQPAYAQPAPSAPVQGGGAPAFDPQRYQQDIALRTANALGEYSSVNSRHYALTGQILDAAPVMAHMQQHNIPRFEDAWRQVHNITAIETQKAQEAEARREAEIRADERQKTMNSQLPSDPQPRFESASAVGSLMPKVAAAGEGGAEQPGHHSRTMAVAARYQQIVNGRGAVGTPAAASVIGAGT